MNNGQEVTRSNGKLASILNDEIPTPTITTSGQEVSQGSKEVTTTAVTNNGKASPKIRKEFKSPSKEDSPSKNDGTTTSKNTNKPSKQTKTAASSKAKPSTNSRKRPLSPSDSEEGREPSQEPERCHHPKHDEYAKNKPPSVTPSNSKRQKLDKAPKLVGMPKRLEGVLNIDRGTKMCSRCINQTDKDPQYTSHKKYVSRKSVYKKNERSRLKIDMKGE